jgi:uncharacterized protein (TIGR03083 family)
MLEAVEAVRADRAALLEICGGLTDSQWRAPSGCPGWSVQDVVSHMSSTLWQVVDASALPDITGMPFEAGMEVLVEARRGEQPDATLADYAKVSETALERLADLAVVDMTLPLGDVGTYPASAMPNAYAFDHYTHIRADLFGPRGPLGGEPPASDEVRVSAALDWIQAALPQQNEALAAQCTLDLQITGTGARVISFGSGTAKATVSSAAPAFVRWITKRGAWPDLGVQAAGDEAALTAARQLRVF